MGWRLDVAEASEHYLTESDLWRLTQQFLLNAAHTTTYKHVLMKALLECTTELDETGKVTFLEISKHVTKIYWNLVITNGLRQVNTQTVESSVEKVLKKFQIKHNVPLEWSFENLSGSLKEELCKSVNQVYKNYVYGSFYSSFNGTVYSFNKKEEWIKIVPVYIVFFEKYKRILMNVTNYQLSIFLEKYNSSELMQNILNKVEFISARHSLKEFKEILLKSGQDKCFYCRKTLKKIHVDHFIPWSYIQNDVLWNFVLSCPRCNSSKNNRIAETKFLIKLVDRNKEIQNLEYMTNYTEKKLQYVYELSKLNDGHVPYGTFSLERR
ncbi:HNH endonuclease [Exiguobacterium oxidotolerans]|uniref:HNH endonuclease n=1 Tax=Exiguobacterium oxidotolerans TaxID=223958 RepID=UPI0013305922|nr:HNH endonuclease signature motif containing protein [Exiguobacterium oxidotolerans]